MKKLISTALAAVMLASSLVFSIPASAATITVGSDSGDCDRVDAPYFEAAPTIDGIVTEAEWGEASVHVVAYDAATKDDSDPYSRFIYWRRAGFDDYSSWEFDLWLRWDVNYFYIAVKAKDPDRHVLKNGAGNTWNGDAIQTRVDWGGRMAATGGAKPWTNEQVPDFLLGYTQIAGGFTEAWENTSNRGMTAAAHNPLGVTQAVVAPAGYDYSSDTYYGITTYEAAIPWAFIIPAADRTKDFPDSTPALTYTEWAGGRKPNPYGGINKLLGMSLAVLDDGMTIHPGWDAFLAWGSGICGAHQEEAGNITTGSNEIRLVEDKIAPQAGYPTQDPSSLLTASFDASNVDAPNVYYDYLAGDQYRENSVSYDNLTVLKYDDPADLSTWGSAKLYNGSIANIGGEHGNVLDYSDPSLINNYLTSEDSETVSFNVPPTFTFEFDIRYTDNVVAGDGADKYAPALYNWFGGEKGIAFRCGYFFNDNAFELVDDEGADGTDPRILARYNYDLKKDNWYKWRFQFDNESCNVRLWIDDLSTEADNKDNKWGTLIFNLSNRYFYYTSENVIGEDADGALLIFRQMNTQTQYDNIRVYNFASNTNIPAPAENENNTDIGPSYNFASHPVYMKEDYYRIKTLSFNIEIDPEKSVLTELNGIDRSAYTIDDLGSGKYTVNITDTNYVKGLSAGDVLFTLVIGTLEENTDIDNVIKDFSDSCTYLIDPASGLGDFDDNGKIDAKDSNTMKLIILGKISDSELKKLADVNGDGRINTKDQYILRMCLAD